MTTDPLPVAGEILSEVEHAHWHAAAALDDRDANSLVAVSWASAHLAAVERVLYPLAARTLPDGPGRVRRQLAVDHRLQQILWALDRRLTGDIHLGRESVRELEDGVRRRLREHVDAERTLIADLRSALGPERQSAVSDELSRAMMRGPTRPHPNTGHSRLTGGLPFWFGGAVDRVRDALDSRSVPTPHREPVPRPLARWGAYLLGVPYQRPHNTARR